MAMLQQVHNCFVWAPLLPTPVTQAMFWSDRPPGLVKIRMMELLEYGMEPIHSAKVLNSGTNRAVYKQIIFMHEGRKTIAVM